MRVTRSRSAGKVPASVKLESAAKVAKSKSLNPALDGPFLDKKTVKNGKNGTSSSVSRGSGVAKLPKSPSKGGPKPHIEQAFAHIKTPANLELPSDFVAYHTPEFVESIKHILSIDPTLYPAIAHGNFEAFARKDGPELVGQDLINSYWYSMIASVISQQVSGSAAKAIKNRFRGLFTDPPTPQATLEIPLDTVKAVGLSSMKLKYVVHISEVFSDPTSPLTSPEFYKNSTTEELISELTKLKGIGEWSAHMFAVFTLKELDVFAYDDLGVARGVARYLQVRPGVLDEVMAGVHAVEELKLRLKRKSKFHAEKSKRDWKPIHDEYVKFLALKFEPHRTAFMLVMWRLSSTNLEVLEKE